MDHLLALIGKVDTIVAVLTILAGSIVGLRDYARRRQERDGSEQVAKL